MSTMIMSACWPLQGMTLAQKAVLISLADNANDQGVCWPSIPTIAARVCASERAVQNAIKWLETAAIVKANRKNGRHTSYMLTPAAYSPPQDMHQRSKCTGEGNAPANGVHHTPAANDIVPRTPFATPPHQVPSNRKEPSIEPSLNIQTSRLAPPVSEGDDKTAKAKDKTAEPDTITLQALVAEGVNRQHAKDWLTARKKKQRPLTLTAWDDVKAEAVKAGMTPAAAVEIAAKNSWAGFRASWLTDGEPAGGVAGAVDAEWHLDMAGIKRRGEALGVRPQKDGEDWLGYKARVFKAAGQGPWIDKLLAEWRGTESVFLSLTEYFNDVRPASAAA